MKKILGIFIMLAVLVFACKKQEPMPAHVEEIYFKQNAPTKLNEGDDINLSSYLVILPESVSDKVTVEWSSSDPEIAIVSENGTVQTLRMGDVTITAKAMDHTASVDLEVEKVRIKEFTIPATFQVYVGSKAKFPITDVSPKGTPLYRFKWEADNDGKKPTYSEGNWYLKADEEREYTLTASVDDAEDAKCQVKFVKPSVSTLAFNPNAATIEEEGSLSLKSNLQITPADGFKADTVKVTWSSNKESVATIDQNGKVQAIAAGKATITAKAGGKTATCSVTVTAKPGSEDPEKPEDPEVPITPIENGHEYVDLGLSVMWATCNVGASAPEYWGDHFAYGETATKKEFTYDNYTFNNQGLYTLPISNDAARANWGGKWRMPTMDECKELINNCTWKYEAAGWGGYTITSNINGKSIFLPFTGRYDQYGLDYTDEGFYWTSTSSYYAGHYMKCEKSRCYISGDNDFYGRAVRPVFTK